MCALESFHQNSLKSVRIARTREGWSKHASWRLSERFKGIFSEDSLSRVVPEIERRFRANFLKQTPRKSGTAIVVIEVRIALQVGQDRYKKVFVLYNTEDRNIITVLHADYFRQTSGRNPPAASFLPRYKLPGVL